MADMITPNFSRAEMSYRCGCGIYEMDAEFIRMLQELRNQMQGSLSRFQVQEDMTVIMTGYQPQRIRKTVFTPCAKHLTF